MAIVRISRDLPPKVTRIRPGMDKDYLPFLRTLPCVVCYPTPTLHMIQAHHLRAAVDGLPTGTSRRNADRYALPLCQRHHLAQYGADSAHGAGNDLEWLIGHGIDGKDLTSALWSVWRNKSEDDRFDAARRVIERAKRK